MARNQFKDEDEIYKCPRCCLALCSMCNDPSCRCDHYKIPAGKPEDEVSIQVLSPLEEADVHGRLLSNGIADLRRSHQSVTEAHRKTGHI